MIPDSAPRPHALALDLINTARPRERGGVDALATPADLRTWLADRELGSWALDTLRSSPADAARLLGEIWRLRDAISRAVEAFRAESAVPAESLFGIDRALSTGRTVRRVEAGPNGLRLREEQSARDLLAVLYPIALGAAELLVSTDPARIRQCASPRCTEWFVDTSKGGRRRWCSMDRCGNRAKAARHRRRRQAG